MNYIYNTMAKLIALYSEVENSRQRILDCCSSLSSTQAQYKPDAESWCVSDVVEHLVRAEQGGVNGMWYALEGFRIGKPVFDGAFIHTGKSIEQIIAETWKPKEEVPAGAGPQWGGPLNYWLSLFKHQSGLLKDLMDEIGDTDPEAIVYPHPISGPLNIIQRFQFLRYHADRHFAQIEKILSHPGFPKA
jgi:hypothetical protein